MDFATNDDQDTPAPAPENRAAAGESLPDKESPAAVKPKEDGAGDPKEHRKHDKHEGEDAKSLKAKIKKKDHELKDLRQAAETLERDLASLQAERETWQAETAGLKDKWLRSLAEMDNQRKRLDREKTEYFQYALGDILREILQVLDNFERALRNRQPGDETGFHEGMELISKQLADLVRKRGVTPVESANARFDPSLHQALLTEESEEVQEAVVGEELQKGYMLGERLLRPALVKVLVPKKDS